MIPRGGSLFGAVHPKSRVTLPRCFPHARGRCVMPAARRRCAWTSSWTNLSWHKGASGSSNPKSVSEASAPTRNPPAIAVREFSLSAFGKGFGCRPGVSGGAGSEAGVRKPPKNEPAGKRRRVCRLCLPCLEGGIGRSLIAADFRPTEDDNRPSGAARIACCHPLGPNACCPAPGLSCQPLASKLWAAGGSRKRIIGGTTHTVDTQSSGRLLPRPEADFCGCALHIGSVSKAKLYLSILIARVWLVRYHVAWFVIKVEMGGTILLNNK